MGLRCVSAGIPILIEKPVADTVADALKLIEAAEAASVPTLTGHHRRHNPIMRRAVELIAEGRIGRPVTASAIWLSHKPKGYHDLAWRREPGGGQVAEVRNCANELVVAEIEGGQLGDIGEIRKRAAQAVLPRPEPVQEWQVGKIGYSAGQLV